MFDTSRLLKISLTLFVVLGVASDVYAQKQGRTKRNFPAHGIEFRPLRDWSDIPISDKNEARGKIGIFQAEDSETVMTPDHRQYSFTPRLVIFKDIPTAAVTDSSSNGGLRGRVGTEKAAESTATDYVLSLYAQNVRPDEFKLIEPVVSDPKIRKADAKREQIQSIYVANVAFEVMFDVYTVQLPSAKIVFVWVYPAEDKKDLKKWTIEVLKAMKTLKIDLDSIEEFSTQKAPSSDDSYADILAFHKQDVEQTQGWRIVETPSKRYIIKTNCEDRKSISKAVKRLEASRDLFEKDFPPSSPIENVSIVRICASKEEFHLFSGTPDGVGGFFRPDTEELVLSFGENTIGLDETLGVMSHEGFHQYCHFLFNRAAAHRWFDEGHGDYYGAFELKGSSLKPGSDMRGGYARLPVMDRMVKKGDVANLAQHVRFTHPEWQGQGPEGVSCYAQSFTLIYFLREGTRGRVSRKYFKKEYKEIIPNYIASLSAGFTQAYEEHVAEQEEKLKLLIESEAEDELIENLKASIAKPWRHLDPRTASDIRAKATGESWGKIDEDQFEQNWLEYVKNELL